MEKKYKRLVSNTVLFAISQFSSRLLFFVMAPLFSYWFDTQEMNGIRDLLNQFANVAIPIVSLGISNAVVRFGLEKNVNKTYVYTNGIISVLMGFGVLVVLSPILAQISWYTDYIVLLCIYVLVSCLRTLNCQFVRAKQYVRLYAVDGIATTIVTCVFYFIFLRNLNMGPTGYLIAVIFADGFSVLFLFITAQLWKYINFSINKVMLKSMLKYSLPLVPASIFWWITSGSSQMFIAAMLENGEAQTAIYANSLRLPTILTIVSTVFTEAWQISAFTDGVKKKNEEFFTKVFSTYQGAMFLCGSGIILMAQPFMMLYRDDYFGAWQYIPFLAIATVFSSLSNFLNSIYMVKKRSGTSLSTMAVGAVINFALNFVLIPTYGLSGAVISTFVSYLAVFLLRAITTRKLIRVNMNPLKLLVNCTTLTLEAVLMLANVPLWPLWCTLLCVLVLMLNLREILMTVVKLLNKKKKA